ncbi:hypothetical protein LDG_6307 [Legionella drancourtii LLAP12]|uniref:Uncharacterized protein n=1 Tax=Legionella drancourtii LLAP12 TaxID=658187 RepID=G9EM45_9GAMM|nr:hypothetical protein LDG_6307 [Legionella drancourtii LLAP12]
MNIFQKDWKLMHTALLAVSGAFSYSNEVFCGATPKRASTLIPK